MEHLELLPRTFTRPANFQIDRRGMDESRNITVRALFDWSIARWVREGPSYFVVSEEETADGLLMTLQIRQPSEVLQWLLSWGSGVKVLEPASLKQRLAEEARAMLQNHQPE